jgi:hypothetical protein
MKCLCAISGLTYSVEYFPGILDSKSTPVFHPVFNLPQKKLLGYLSKWSSGDLTLTDSYLLFLSILNSSDLVEFRVPVKRTEETDSLVSQNMENLAKIVWKLSSVSNPTVSFPSYSVSPDTCTLSNIKYWIENWESSYDSFTSGYRNEEVSRSLRVKEAVLERLIKNPHKPISDYAKQLAEWASVSGSFPTYNTISPFSTLPVTMSDYWKQIIIKISKAESVYQVPKIDLEDLLEHCEQNIPVGSGIFSHNLFKLLRTSLEKHKAFLGFGDQDLISTSYTILSETSGTEAANLKNLIDLAPDHMPQRSEYPTDFAYFRAKMRYTAAKKAGA